ncbi:MAG: hypothetical protein GH155_03395 [Spirochaeta sp.]|nr:hypothetical protein [Spirochaeta sp.]
MKIKIKYNAILNLPGVTSGSEIEIKDGATITELLALYRIKEAHQRYIIPFVNGQNQRLSYKLGNGDSLNLLLPAGGG